MSTSPTRQVLCALGAAPARPTTILSDNKANVLVASGRAIPSRSRHCLRRYLTFLQRVDAREVEIGHVPDPENPADFMTKWVPVRKVDASLDYATNRRNRDPTG